MKPLYLNPDKPTRVILNGRGLRVRVQGAADRLFPLKRLSRILVNSRVDWATDALLACAQAGIPIHFVRHDGTLCARVMSGIPRENWLQLQTLFSDFLDLPGGAGRYRGWVNAKIQQAQLQCAQTAEQGPWSITELSGQLQLQAQKYARKADLKRFDMQLRTLVKFHIEQQLHGLCIDPDAVDLLLNDIQLLEDLTEIIIWTQQAAKLAYVRPAYTQHRKHHTGLARLDWCHSIRFIESRHSDLDNKCLTLLRNLFTCMLEEVNSHGFQ